MRTGTASWILLAGAAICSDGCGGSLSSGVGGAGGGAEAGTTGAAGRSGPGGTSGVAGSFGLGGDNGGAPYYGVTTWGDVRVEVGPTTAAAGTLILQVTDRRVPDQFRTLTFPPATKWSPNNDGAYVQVLFGCGSAAVDRVSLYSCPADGVAGGTVTPGCIGLTFDSLGPMGNFTDSSDGTRCDVRGGAASFLVPAPDFSDPANGTTRYAATGSFLVDCVRGDGTHLDLQGRFMLPVQFSFLIC